MLNYRSLHILIALLGSLIGIFTLVFKFEYQSIRPFVFISFALFTIICFLELGNIFFLARTFFIGFIGFFPIMVKSIFGENIFFSQYEKSTQSFDLTVLMYVTTSLALLSNSIGLYMGDKSKYPIYSDYSVKQSGTIGVYWQIAFFISVPIVMISSYFFSKAYGETIFTAGYTMSSRGSGLTVGSIGVFGITALYLIFVSGLKKYVKHWFILFIPLAIYFIVYSQLLHGLRQDAITPIFGLLILYGVIHQKAISLKMKYLPIIFLGYIFFEAWGIIRFNLAFIHLNPTFFASVFTSMFDGDTVAFGTISPISTTFSNTVWLIESGQLDLSWGKSYFEFLLRTPPSFIYPNRSDDYALLFGKYGLSAGGGFFELAEVYMNFGMIGALFVPGIISYLMAKSYHFALEKQSILSYLLLCSFLSVFLRGTWYQTFAFYRGFLVCLMLYLMIVSIRDALFKKPVHK